jgi:hypothetical protein
MAFAVSSGSAGKDLFEPQTSDRAYDYHIGREFSRSFPTHPPFFYETLFRSVLFLHIKSIGQLSLTVKM